MALTRRDRRTGERQRAALATLRKVARLPVYDGLRAGLAAAGAFGILTQDVLATALGAVTAGLVYAVLVYAARVTAPAPTLEQTVLRVERVLGEAGIPAPSRDLPAPTWVSEVDRALATARAATPPGGVPVPPTINGVRPVFPRQRLRG